MKKRMILTQPILLLIVILFSSPLLAENQNLPPAAAITLQIAERYAQKKVWKEAIRVLKEFQNRQNQSTSEKTKRKGYAHPMIDYALGNYALSQSRVETAIRHYQDALEKADHFSPAWINLAKCYYDTDQMEKAGNAFFKGYNKGEKKTPRYLYYSIVSFVSVDQYQKAYDLFQIMLQSHPDKILLSWNETYAQILLSLDKHLKALPILETLAEKSPSEKKKQWQKTLLYQYLHLDMTEKALIYVEKRMIERVTEPDWWRATAHIHLNRGAYDKGLVALIALSFLTPLTDEEMHLLGDLYMTLEIPKQAASCYSNLLEKNLNHSLLKKMVHAQLRQYDTPSAIGWIDSALSKKKDDPSLSLLKGKLLFETHNFEAAAAIFKNLSTADEKNTEAALLLGYAYWHLNRIKPAIIAFKHAVKGTPQNKAARLALETLENMVTDIKGLPADNILRKGVEQ